MYVLVAIPVVVMVILMIFGMSIDGSRNGVTALLYPTASKLLSPGAWKNAAGQVLFSIGLGTNIWPYLASNNKYSANAFYEM